MKLRGRQRCQRVSTLSAPLASGLRPDTVDWARRDALTTADSADGKEALKAPPAAEVSAVSLARADTPRLFTPSYLYFPLSPFRRNPLTPLTPFLVGRFTPVEAPAPTSALIQVVGVRPQYGRH